MKAEISNFFVNLLTDIDYVTEIMSMCGTFHKDDYVKTSQKVKNSKGVDTRETFIYP